MADAPKVPRTFWSKAYLKEEDPGTFQLYRDVLVEGKDSSGAAVREKIGKPIPVGRPLREIQKGEEARVIVRSFHPIDQRPIELVEVDA
jgi:hypothetical protein